MNRNNIYTVNPLYNGLVTPLVDEATSGGTTIIYQQGGGGGGGLTDALKLKLDGIQEGAEVNQNAYSKVRLNNNDTLILEATSKTATLNLSGVYPVLVAINQAGGLDFTVSSDSTNNTAVVTQKQLADALAKLEEDKYWKLDADGKLYTELDVYSQKEVSAYGAGPGGGGTGGASALYELVDVLRDGDKVQGSAVGSILSYNGSHWYAIPQSAITPDLTNYATKSYVTQLINDLIGGAPGTLDTLKEIAEALGNDPNFAATMTDMINKIGLRVTDLEGRMASFDDMFEWDKTASASDASLWRIKAKKDLYGVGEISAYGYSSGTVPTGAQYMYELKDVLFTELTSGQLLQWNGTKWINIDKNAVGLNESELAKYLTTNNYAKKTDITWANLLNKPTTWAWADITGKPTTLAGYGITDGVPNTRRVSAGSGLSGGGVLSSDVTISLGTIGTAGTYTKVTTDMYGRVVSGTTLSESDIPTLLISKISGLQTALDSKLNTSDFSTWFTINKNASGLVISIQANFDFFGVGEISAYGLGETQPSVTTLAGLDDVTITSPANGQTLIYDSATSQWKNGTIIGGGNISLNGTVYKPVNGTITLPNLYEKVSGGTASQFLKADGSIDSNLYALAYGGNQQQIFMSRYLNVADRRNETIIPSSMETGVNAYFTVQDTPYSNWRSTLRVKGWTSDYASWELTGPSHNDDTKANERLYYRYGFNSSWKTGWKPLAFLEDISNVADVYFNGQEIHNDYGHWVVGLIRIGTADIGDKYISGEMIYRRSNGFYSSGSVRFNLIKKYNSTQMFAGAFYNGYGIGPDQDAPRLCTFTYQGVKWGGLCWRSTASLDSIKTIIYDNSSTDTPFYVLYYKSNIPDVTNPEINNSISVLGSDIDTQPISTTGRIYTSDDRIEINNIRNGWAYTRYRTDGRYVDTGLSGTTGGLCGLVGNYEIRPTGSNNEGIFVRYSQSDYGKLGVVNRSGQQASIGYFNNNTAVGADKPLWTVGAGLRNAYSFDWYFGTNGIRMTLDSDGKLFVQGNGNVAPTCSLTIGDRDTGLNWESDGVIQFRSNAKKVGHWGYTNSRLHGCEFREAYNNDYNGLGLMVNGNGTANTVKPGIGFHQPGVYAGSLRLDAIGNWSFCVQGGSIGGIVQAGSFYANGGWLYSNVNGCEIRIGSQNTSYVHITNNANRPYYFDHGVITNGGIDPYEHNKFTLGSSPKYWAGAYISRVYGQSDTAIHLITNYKGGIQPNPQTYFGKNVGVKVAMTGSLGGWSDTLWINGYSGGDVLGMCALHFSRGGNPNMYISCQNSNATSYGTLYSVWTGYNSNKSDVNWNASTLFTSIGLKSRNICIETNNSGVDGGCSSEINNFNSHLHLQHKTSNHLYMCKGGGVAVIGDINAQYKLNVGGDIIASSWIRTNGATGWYSQSYGGGIYMNDSDQVQVYNNKVFYNSGYRSWGIGGHFVALKLYNASHIGLNLANNSYTWGIYSNNNGNMYIGRRDGNVNNSSGTYVVTIGLSTFSMSGNIVASGEVTAYSDARLKSSITDLKVRGRLKPKTYVKDGKWSIGFVAQEVQALYPELVHIGTEPEHYLSLNYGNITAVLAALINTVEDEVTTLKNKVKQLESEVTRLNALLPSQGIQHVS